MHLKFLFDIRIREQREKRVHYHIKVFHFNSNAPPASHKQIFKGLSFSCIFLSVCQPGIFCTSKNALYFTTVKTIQTPTKFFSLVGNSAQQLKEFSSLNFEKRTNPPLKDHIKRIKNSLCTCFWIFLFNTTNWVQIGFPSSRRVALFSLAGFPLW